MENLTINLIDSTLEREEAYEVLIALVDAKINFHKRKCFSDSVRFGADVSKSQSRISELKMERRRLEDYFMGRNQRSSEKIQINSRVYIGLSEDQEQRHSA
ncbi:MAG: hypothetical protein H6606_00790 [Flavobacteriales bacterium]|nr:hypothetical protein [Flavobacteriales bacterium]